MKHAVYVHGDDSDILSALFRLCRKHRCGFHTIRENVYVLPKPVLDELQQEGFDYESVELSQEEAKQVMLHLTMA